MKKTLLTGLAGTLLLVLVSTFAVKAQTADVKARTAVANLYKAAKSKNMFDWSRTELEKYFTKALAGAIYKSMKSEDGLDFDILYYAQDTEVTGFLISGGNKVTAGAYQVIVKFKNSGQSERLFFTLEKDFKVSNIKYNDGKTADSHTLLEILKN
jgi:hypothetical protein